LGFLTFCFDRRYEQPYTILFDGCFSLKNIHQKNKIGWRKGRTPSAEASGVGLRPFIFMKNKFDRKRTPLLRNLVFTSPVITT
jgi:hypothetical protein